MKWVEFLLERLPAVRRARAEAAFWKEQFEEWHRIAWDVSRYAPKPTCSCCGSENLCEDPAGYYSDARRFDGASLLCLDCRK